MLLKLLTNENVFNTLDFLTEIACMRTWSSRTYEETILTTYVLSIVTFLCFLRFYRNTAVIVFLGVLVTIITALPGNKIKFIFKYAWILYYAIERICKCVRFTHSCSLKFSCALFQVQERHVTQTGHCRAESVASAGQTVKALKSL